MHLLLSIDKRADAADVALEFTTIAGTLKYTVDGVADVQRTITNLLLFAYARKADHFVATCMDLSNVKVNEVVSNAINQMALLVIELDTADLDTHTANAKVRAKTPAMLHLVGRSTWSGHAPRRKEFDELTMLAELINERVMHPEHESCPACLMPQPNTVCGRCTKATAA